MCDTRACLVDVRGGAVFPNAPCFPALAPARSGLNLPRVAARVLHPVRFNGVFPCRQILIVIFTRCDIIALCVEKCASRQEARRPPFSKNDKNDKNDMLPQHMYVCAHNDKEGCR